MNKTVTDDEFDHATTDVNGIEMHYAEAGSGPLVVLLHGFPEFWYAWAEHMEMLADEDYRVVAPDLRGYNRTDRPEGISSYTLPTLADDVIELIESLDDDEVILVGHDWGGIVAWRVASERPDLLSDLVTVNGPHPAISLRELQKPSNLPTAWYFFFYQLPAVPELLMKADDFSLMESAFRSDTTTDDAFSEAEIDRYKQMMADPGLFSAAINYDRGLFRVLVQERFGSLIPGMDDDPIVTDMHIEVPSLVLWGLQDSYYHPEMLDGLDEWVEELTVETYPDASHWLPAEYPEEVVDQITAFVDE